MQLCACEGNREDSADRNKGRHWLQGSVDESDESDARAARRASKKGWANGKNDR